MFDRLERRVGAEGRLARSVDRRAAAQRGLRRRRARRVRDRARASTDLNADVLRVLETRGDRGGARRRSAGSSPTSCRRPPTRRSSWCSTWTAASSCRPSTTTRASTSRRPTTSPPGARTRTCSPWRRPTSSDAPVIIDRHAAVRPGRAADRGRRGGPEPRRGSIGSSCRQTGLGETGEAYLVGSRRALRPRAACARSSPTAVTSEGDRPGARRRPTDRGSTTTTRASP